MNIDPRKFHKPQEPLVKIATIFRMFSRQAHPQGPEANLVVGVICQAIYDCLYASLVEKSRAWNFLQDERLHVWASTVSLDADFIRDVASKTGYMSKEPPHKVIKKKKEAQLA